MLASSISNADNMIVKNLRLSIIVPTFNESQNVAELLSRLKKSLGPHGWEIIFVDDNSPDGTASVVRNIAMADPRVRCIQRIGRRGLSSACVEGILGSSAPVIAVMDADLQHDETILPEMMAEIEQNGADIVIGTRYAKGGSTGDWNKSRKIISRLSMAAGRSVLSRSISDPMSGFFMLQRKVFDAAVHHLSAVGFKILLDILASTKHEHLKISEVPYHFKNRHAGESKLDEMVAWEYFMLLADKIAGRFIPVRFLSFSIIGGLGVFVHMVILTLTLKMMKLDFAWAQSFATCIAMVFNFTLNNILTYRDRRLKGLAWVKGLLSFMLACSIGALSNVGVATYLFKDKTQWILAALAGVLVSAVWNYAVTQIWTWDNDGRK
jgi:dolichol-phosphate mannosyltransferase